MNSSEITAVILTFNEAPNIERTLEKLTWLRQIVIVDSFSTDETLQLVKPFPNVRVVQRKFDNHTAQWNFAIAQCATDWVLTFDADYVASDQLINELRLWRPADDIDACFARFRYCIYGKPLTASLYPPRAVLFRRHRCYYEQHGHTQLLRVNGKAGWLAGKIEHDDRKSLDRWVAAQITYSALEATHLNETAIAELNWPDRIRKKII